MTAPSAVMIGAVLQVAIVLFNSVGWLGEFLPLRAATAIPTFLLVLGFWTWVAWATFRGRRWARVVTMVSLALVLVTIVVDAVGGAPLAPLDLISPAVLAAIVVLLWLPASRAYFVALKQTRAAVPEPPSKEWKLPSRD